jgi:hypothetical protein
MVRMREIIADYSGNVDGLSVHYYMESESSAFQQRNNARAFYAAITEHLTPSTTVTIRTTGNVVNSTDGAVVDSWSDSTSMTEDGTNTTDLAVAQATQVFVRLRTTLFWEGRRVQGGLYVPGLSVDRLTANGELDEAARADFETSANNLLLFTDEGRVIWSRPQPGRDGTLAGVTAAQVSAELSTQRRRRRA